MALLVCLAHVPTPAITHGFVPAAKKLGLEVVILTDRPAENSRELEGQVRIIGCDVFHPVTVIDTICNYGLKPDAVFSNSDHLQTATSIAAQYVGVPHKSMSACYRAKHKGEMRRELARLGIEEVDSRLFRDLGSLQAAHDLPFPCVLKPCKGVASLGVRYAENRAELLRFAELHFTNSSEAVLVEEYLDGTIYSLETLGDAEKCHVLGGFTCSLGERPSFIEVGARWGLGAIAEAGTARVMAALEGLGATFGACHTEFVESANGPRIIEVNYRSIGDQSDFMLDNLYGKRYFEAVLRVQLGERVDLPAPTSESHSSARYVFAQRSGRIRHIPDGFKREQAGCAVHYVPARKIDDVVELSGSNKDYLALLHVTGPGHDHVENLLRQETAALEAAIQWA